jgi:hypothetical protein
MRQKWERFIRVVVLIPARKANAPFAPNLLRAALILAPLRHDYVIAFADFAEVDSSDKNIGPIPRRGFNALPFHHIGSPFMPIGTLRPSTETVYRSPA